MASRTTNTMSEVLISILQILAEAKVMPDADLPWIINLETQVADKARAPYQQQQSAPPPAPPGADMAGALMGAPPIPGGMPGGGDPMAAMAGGGGGAPMQVPGMAAPMSGGRAGMGSVDELSRLLGSGPPRGGRYGPS